MLDIKQAVDVTAEVPIYDTFAVLTRVVTNQQWNQLIKDCHGVNKHSAFLTDEERSQRFDAAFDERAPDIYFKGWRGLTLRVAAHLGIAFGTPPELVEEQDPKSTEENPLPVIQVIPYSPEHGRLIWKHAYPERFRNILAARSKDILEAHALEERERGNS